MWNILRCMSFSLCTLLCFRWNGTASVCVQFWVNLSDWGTAYSLGAFFSPNILIICSVFVADFYCIYFLALQAQIFIPSQTYRYELLRNEGFCCPKSSIGRQVKRDGRKTTTTTTTIKNEKYSLHVRDLRTDETSLTFYSFAIKLVARKLKLCQLAETPYRMLPFSHVWKADLCTGKVMRMIHRCKSKAGVTLVEPYPRTVKAINFILFNPFTPEEGLAQSASTRPSVRNVPILIPRCDLKFFFPLLSFRCSFK